VGCQFVHHAALERLGGLERAPFQQQRQGRRNADKARQPLRAAAARQQPHLHLGQAQLHGCVVGGHAPVAGQCQLQPAAQRRAFDGAGHGLAAGLEPPQLMSQRGQPGHQGVGRQRGCRCAEFLQSKQVGANQEVGLGRAQQHTAHPGGLWCGQPVQVRSQFSDEGVVDDVGVASVLVQRQGADALRVERAQQARRGGDVGHAVLSQSRSMMAALPMPAATHKVARP
jgi:hypothetical protein